MRTLLGTTVLFLIFSVTTFPQNCAPPSIVFNAKTENIFSPEQEMFLGDAMMARLEKDYRVIDDETVNGYLQSMGDRIIKHLPATGIRFRFVIVDTAETNAHAMAGGRIFVTRKMISFVRNEDELAGVLGHELGHAVVRHHAIDISRYFKELLGVTSVGDRRDVFDKYNRFLETYRTKLVRFANNHSDNKQIEADRIGLFATYAAGYDPNAMLSFWKRFTDAKKRSFLSDLFGSTTPEDKRLREMIDAMKQIPTDCLDKPAALANSDFEKWRLSVINFSGLGAKESLKGLISRKSLVPLRSDIEHLRFSPNGEYILAQDNSTISVLKREPLSILFRIDVEDAYNAAFSSDSKTLVVHNKNLRVQKWSIAEKRLIETNEIAMRGGYWQTHVSPDGKYIASYRYSGDLVIYDVATNNEIFKEKDFYLPSYFEVYLWQFYMNILDLNEFPAINLKFSPDGRYLLAGRKSNPGGFAGSRQETVAVDMTTRKTISIGDNIKTLLVTAMDFLGSDKIIGQYGGDIKRSGIFAFPTGDRIDQFELSGESFMSAEAGDFVTVRPVSGAAVGVYDLKAKKYVLANKKSAMDLYDKTYVAERRNGEIALYSIGTVDPVATVSLPASPFGSLRTWAVSADGKWLTLSDRSRGAAWNIATGERVQHIRTFRGSFFAEDGKVYADFPKRGETERTIAVMDLNSNTVVAAPYKLDNANIRQHGRYLVIRKPLKEEKEKEKKQDKSGAKNELYREEERDKRVGSRETSMELRDVISGASLWTRNFEEETPNYFVNPIQNTMILYWPLGSKAAKNIVDRDTKLQQRVSSMEKKDDDLLIQFIDPKSGHIKGNFLLETGEGSFSVDNITTGGDYMIIDDNENRILVYSISAGRLINRFFGSGATFSPESNMIAIENILGRMTIYDLNSGKELDTISFTKPITVAQFLEDGKRLFVLTSDQTAFIFDATKFGVTSNTLAEK